MSLEEIKELQEKNAELFSKFQVKLDERDKAAGDRETEFKNTLGAMEVKFMDLEKEIAKKQDEYKAELEDRDKLIEAGEKRADKLEAKMNLPGQGSEEIKLSDYHFERSFNIASNNPKHAEERKAFDSYARSLAIHPNAEEIKVMSVADPTSGGYLAPIETVDGMIRVVVDMTPAMQIANVRNTTKGTVRFRKRTSIPSMTRYAELATKTENTGLAFGMEEILLPEAAGLILISNHDLEDTDFPLEAEIRNVLGEMATVLIGAEFISGNGIAQKEMEGIAVNGNIGNTASGTSNILVAGTLIDLQHTLKIAYQGGAQFLCNLATLGKLRQLVGGDAHYLWAPGMGATPNTFLGKPYTLCEDLPDVSTGNVALYYGDFKNGYEIVFRLQLTIQKLIELYAVKGYVGFLGRVRFGGAVVLAEAIKKYTIT